MKYLYIILAIPLASVEAVPTRIFGGSLTTIDQYPQMVSLLYSRDGSTFWQSCGGTIINTRNVLTAAQCVDHDQPARVKVRVGSTWANSGGTVHSIMTILMHPAYNQIAFLDSDISIIRTASAITYVNNAVQPGIFAGTNYNTGDNAIVWATGWGYTETWVPSEQLRDVQVWTINQDICRQRYFSLTDNMLCSGWLDVGGRDQCGQDSGGPVYHNGVVVGVSSFGFGCGDPFYPGVNVRVSRFSTWIQANA